MAYVSDSKDAEHISKKVKIMCNPCEHAGLGREAAIYCKQCEEYMCTPCATIHGRLKLSRGHILESIPGLPSVEQFDARKSFQSYCADHKDELMELFCEEHEETFCDSCKFMKHRECTVVSVHDMAQAATCGQQLPATLDAIVELKARIENIKTERENGIDALKHMEKSCVAEIKAFKAKLIQMVKRLESEILADVNKIIEKELGLLLGHVGACDVLLRQVNTAVKDANEAKSVADGFLSVLVANKLRATRHDMASTITDIETKSYRVDINYIPSLCLLDIQTSVDRLGVLQVTPATSISHSICPVSTPTLFTDMHVDYVMKIDVPSKGITGSTILPDGQVILVDNSNKQVILLDKILSLKSTLSLTDKPWAVAADGTNEVIVTMPDSKKLQWIGVGSTLLAGRTVTTTHYKCYGVAVHAGEIYTSGLNDMHCKMYSTVCVLNREGNMTRSVGYQSDIPSEPYYITVNSQGSVYVSDCTKNRIACFTATAAEYSVTHTTHQVQQQDMSFDENDNIFVCCQPTNQIHVIKKDGSCHRVLASSTNDLVKPRSVSYRRCDHTLIVTMENTPSCVAYTLK